MDSQEDIFIKSRPQSLCLMCGKCCKVSTTTIPYEQLKTLAESGDKGAIDFLDIFEPYKTIDAAKKVDEKTVNSILDLIKTYDATDETTLTFYKCKHLLDNNLCGIYNERKDLCNRFPSSIWAIIPAGCGFEGFLFQKREELKQSIRKQKENLLTLDLLFEESENEEQKEKIEQLKEKIEKTIESYAKYGSKNW